ncbi:MAG: hypothetical protein HC800_13580 [Phormidesmis sp. RL_2_1]|nr:hypothetical protein [Phormidesmis sp. RL_2_1]
MANEFDGLFAARRQGKSTQTPDSDANKTQKTQKTKTASKATPPPTPEPPPAPAAAPIAEPPAAPSDVIAPVAAPMPTPEPPAVPKKKKRGRPATGKRSDEGWIGRTYYIQEKTDIDIAEELVALRRQGVSLDKSELVDALLSTWVSWRKGEDANNRLGEFSPRRKDG